MPDPIPAWQPPLVDRFVSTDSSNQLIHYLGDVFDWHGYVKFLSLAALRDTSRDVPLEKLFVEPHVAAQHLSPDALAIEPPPPTEALSAALARHPRLVLLGDPGSGKSTVVNWICTALGRGMDGPLAKLLGGPLVPLPFVLRELGIGGDFARLAGAKRKWERLLELFAARPVTVQLRDERRKGVLHEHGLLFQLLESGQAILLLDGIDEIGSIGVREALRDAIHEGMRRHPRARWVLTSRIVGYEEVEFEWLYPPLSDPWLFQGISEEPGYGGMIRRAYATDAETGEQWVGEVQPIATRLYLAPFNDPQIEQFTRLWWAHHESNPHLAGTKPTQFIAALQASHGAKSLARLPHLLTMMALIYRVQAELPDGRALLYKFIADAYLGTLDKERGLDHLRPIPANVEEMSRWLAAIGWRLQQRRSAAAEDEEGQREVLIEEHELLALLGGIIQPKGDLTAAETARLFLEYAGRRSGLLLPRGDGLYAFLHLSFQEYFASLFLRDRVGDPDWLELVDENERDQSGLADLRSYASSSLWRETLIFLWENAALINPKLPERLLVRLLGWKRDPVQWADFPFPTKEEMMGWEDHDDWDEWEPRERILLARLSLLGKKIGYFRGLAVREG